MRKNTIISFFKNPIAYIVLLIFVFFIDYPFLWMISGSFKSTQEIYSTSSLLPKKVIFSNYAEAWGKAPWVVYFKNSIIVSVIPILGQIFLGSMAAFAFTRKFRGSRAIFTLFLGTMMIPLCMRNNKTV
jgi:multiple sugar transport system permease protein